MKPDPSLLTQKIKNLSKQDRDLIERAYKFAERYHDGQKRYSGEPYFTHCFETALILTEIDMSPTVIAAGLLHDVDEDTQATPEDIEKEFGQEILGLVEGVTKLGQVRFKGMTRHTESLRKLFIATSEDIRVMIIKLADRLHNIRTLEHVPKEKQLRIASETIEIYAPIAQRLGIRQFSKELEDGCFPYVHPEEYKKIAAMLRDQQKKSDKQLASFHRRLQKELGLAGFRNAKTSFRTKGLYSLYMKLNRKEWNLEQVYDVSAIRIIVPSVSDCYRVLGIVHSNWQPLIGRVKDYIATPKPMNGYRSIHTDVYIDNRGKDENGMSVEIQIRTQRMHEEAEYGIASHLGYKDSRPEGGGALHYVRTLMPGLLKKTNHPNEDASRDIPTWLKDLVRYQEDIKGEEFIENLKRDFLSYRMFVFTPDGEVVDLPIDSTTIDFAYAIHTDLGNHTSGAKVNGKMKSIDTVLKNGDKVEILTNENNHPKRKWLDFVKTTMARKHIRSYLNNHRDSPPIG